MPTDEKQKALVAYLQREISMGIQRELYYVNENFREYNKFMRQTQNFFLALARKLRIEPEVLGRAISEVSENEGYEKKVMENLVDPEKERLKKVLKNL